MNVGEMLDYINELAPWGYAEVWDNVGLMVGSRTCKVNKVLLCMDVTDKVIKEAIDLGVNLILSHHPFLFSKLNKLDFDTLKGAQISALIKNNICVISAHTNLDVAAGGVNDTLAEALGLIDCNIYKSYIPDKYDIDLGMGKYGQLQDQLGFEDFISMVKQNLAINNLRIIGTQPEKVNTIAVFCGSFDGDLQSVKNQNVDVLVTGDIKYHTALDAKEMGLCIIDVGHFASEHLIVNKLYSLLVKSFKELQVYCSKMEADPFIFS